MAAPGRCRSGAPTVLSGSCRIDRRALASPGPVTPSREIQCRCNASACPAVDRACAKGAGCWGTWHFAGEGVTTWHGFATEIVAAAAPRLGKKPTVTPITTRDYPTPARRPANSELDSKLFAAIFGYRAQPWPERTRDVVRELLA